MNEPDTTSPDRQRLADTRLALPLALLRAREAVMARFRPILARHGINEQQWRVIRVLAEQDGLDASEVARRTAILAPSLTRMLRSMEDRGLVRRTGDPADGRRVILRIAPEGLRLIAEVSPESLEQYRQIETAFGTERLTALLQLLDDLSRLDPDS